MPRFCAHLGYLFGEVPMAQRFEAAAASGFCAIEHPGPYAFGIAEFSTSVRRHQLEVAQIAAPSGDPECGEKGFACLAGRQPDFRISVVAGVEAATEIGVPLLHIMPGVLPQSKTRDDCRQVYLDNLSWAAERCDEAGIDVLIEAISDETVPGFYVNHPEFAIDLISELGHERVHMLFDVYHAAVKGIDALAFIEEHLPRIAHIQIADFPGRNEPGSGTLPFSDIFARLDALDYKGWVGCEYKPHSDTRAGLGWLGPTGSYRQ